MILCTETQRRSNHKIIAIKRIKQIIVQKKEKKKTERDSPMHSPWKSAAQLRQLTEAHGKKFIY